MIASSQNECRREERKRRLKVALAGRVGRGPVSDILRPLLLVVALCGWPFSASPAGTASPQAVPLEHKEQAYAFFNLRLGFVIQTEPFVQEPEVGAQAIRGKLVLGGDEQHALAILWDRGASRLHLDLNRNLDLTDDTEGVIQAEHGHSEYYQSFNRVVLPMLDPPGARFVGDLSLWHYGNRPEASFASRSLWEGHAVLQGVEWQIGLIHSDLNHPVAIGNAFLLLRPWSSREEPFRVTDGSLRTFRLSPSLFLNEHSYDISLGEPGAGELRLTFEQTDAVLGDVEIAGEHVQRLVLEGQQRTVVLDQPSGHVRLPVGNYSAPQAWLRHGNVGARTVSTRSFASGTVTVSESIPVVLEVGGPLTNSVTVSRRGSRLRMDYQLLGRGGQVYRLDNEDRSNPPGFAVYRKGRQIHAGQFEFG